MYIKGKLRFQHTDLIFQQVEGGDHPPLLSFCS